MPKLNHTGPEGKGPRTGRGLGRCKKPAEPEKEATEYHLGQGMARKRKTGCGEGKGKRLQSGIGTDKT